MIFLNYSYLLTFLQTIVKSNFKKSLSIDHNHQTGKVRGLLCHHCNVGLGHFKDNIELLNSALDYLIKTEKY